MMTAILAAAFALLVALPLAGFLGLAGGAAFGYTVLAGQLEENLEQMSDIEARELFQTTRIYDRNGVLLREMFSEGKRTYIPISEIPLTVRQATIAVEDKTFYENAGIDALGILRAALHFASAGDIVSGGSTITQQLVKHVAFSYEERVDFSTMARVERKVKEIPLSMMLAERYSKDQILEWYLNEIYYGNLAYGIEAASRTIFDKPASELTLAESALLAGLPQIPARYDPLSPDPDVQRSVRDRQRVVLELMADNGFISRAEAEAAAREEMVYADPNDDLFEAPHFVVHVQELLEERIGAERLAKGGLEVYTTLDTRLQAVAERVVRENVEQLQEAHDLSNAALVAMEPRSGQVLAMVGSVDYWDDGIDGRVNVALRERQPGSSIKPVTYLTAIENGMSPATQLWDTPMELWTPNGIYEPVNYDETFRGPVRLREALANSYNIPALKLLAAIQPRADDEDAAGKHGVELTVETAKRLGITGLNRDPWDYGLSLTLGGGEVTLYDMTTVYGTLANGGGLVRPQEILRITDAEGEVLYDLADDEAALTPEEAADPRAVHIVRDIMADNEARAPSFGANSALYLGVPAAAKTGTTNDFKDNWTVGFTPYLVTGVWAGNSDNTPMRNSSGLTGAAPIWNAFMGGVIFDEDLRQIVWDAREELGFEVSTEFREPEGLVRGRVCRLASLNQELASTCREWREELFVEEYLPEGVVPGEGAQAAAPAGFEDVAGLGEAMQAPRGGSDGSWTVVPSAVIPLPPPPPEVVAAAEEAGEPVRWPSAALCLAGASGFGSDKVQPVAVLPLPTDEEEREKVREWARESGWVALEPVEPCTQEMVDAALPAGSLPGFAEGAVLSQGASYAGIRAEYSLGLAPGAVLGAATTITGTAVFDPQQIEYFKVELGPGASPTEWITIGDIHPQPVRGGALETLDASALAPGPYILRLVLVKKDGNFLEPPYSVPFRVGAAPAEPAE